MHFLNVIFYRFSEHSGNYELWNDLKLKSLIICEIRCK
jgi:hypothetical protein